MRSRGWVKGWSLPMAQVAKIQIGPCKTFDPSTLIVTTTTRTPDLAIRSVEGATRDDLATARQIAWWQNTLCGRTARYGSPRLAHRTGFYSAWSLADLDGRWVICLEVWEMGVKRTTANTTTVYIPSEANPQAYLDQLDGTALGQAQRAALAA